MAHQIALIAAMPRLARAAIILLTGILVGCSCSPTVITPPRIAAGGRAIAIGVTSTNDQQLIVASETGGLFQTYDGGKSWLHVGGFPSYKAIDVAVASLAPQTIIATAQAQYRVVNDGGIWRSTNGGTSWQQPVGWAPPRGANCPGRPSAYGISNMPLSHTIYVGTDCGLAVSTDDGATWTNMILPGSPTSDSTTNRVHAVLVVNSTSGVAVGDRGMWYLTPKGTWAMSTANPDGGETPPTHGFASPWFTGVAGVFFHASVGQRLWLSTDGGANWTQVSAPSNNNREAFVRVARSVSGDDSKFDVYYGDGVNISRQSFSVAGTVGSSWTQLTVDHSDPADIAFDQEFRDPILLATDGGVHLTTDKGSSWTLTGGGYGGFDALQVSEIDGQSVGGASPHLDLYFGTQDNSIWASGDGGQTWPKNICCEGRYMRLGAQSSPDQELRVTGSACGPCSNFLAGAQFQTVGSFPNAPSGNASDAADAPFELTNNVYVQDVVNQTASPPSFDYYLTTSAGAPWTKQFSFALPPAGAASFAGAPGNQTMYEGVQRPGALSNGGILYGINRVTNITGQPVVTRADSLGMGGVGSLRTPIARYIVFGVDPRNAGHLIAPDVESGDMKFSDDSGLTWFPLPALTQAVTDSGRYLFTLAELSQASVVAWDPYNSCHILVGTNENGVLRSTDGGNTWTQIAGSQAAANVSSFFFPPSGSVWMSTDGRSLWTLSLDRPAGGSGTKCRFPTPPSRFPVDSVIGINPTTGAAVMFTGLRDTTVCRTCVLVAVRDGWVTGLTLLGDTVKHITISGGTIAELSAASKEVPLAVGNSYGPGRLQLPKGAATRLLTGTRRVRALVLDGQRLKVLVVSSTDLPFAPAHGATALVLSATRPGARSIGPDDSIRVIGSYFVPPARGGRPVQLSWDHAVGDSVVAVRPDGSFSVALPIHHAPGDLIVTVTQRDGNRVTMARGTIEISTSDDTEGERRTP